LIEVLLLDAVGVGIDSLEYYLAESSCNLRLIDENSHNVELRLQWKPIHHSNHSRHCVRNRRNTISRLKNI